MAFQAGAIVGEMRLDVKPFRAAIEEASRSVERLRREMERARVEQRFAQEFARTRVQVDQTGASIGNLIGLASRLGIAYFGVRSVVNFFKDAAAAAIEAERATAILARTTENAGVRWEEARGQVQQYTADLARLSGFSRTELTVGLNQALAATQNLTRSLRIVSAAADLARGTGMDLQTAVLLIARASEFGTVRLRSLGLRLRDNATDLEILEEIERRFAGSSQAHMATAAGAVDEYRNAVAELKQKIGDELLPVLTQNARSLTETAEGVDRNIDAFRRWREEIPLWRRAIGLGFLDLLRMLREAETNTDRVRRTLRQMVAGGQRDLMEQVNKPLTTMPFVEMTPDLFAEWDRQLKAAAKSASQVNEALQRALQTHELVNLRTGRGAEEQITDLQRIRALYAKNAEERLRLDIMIAQQEQRARQERFRARVEEVEDSRRFVQRELIDRGASFAEILAGFQRTIERIKAIRAEDAEDARRKTQLLRDVQADMFRFLEARAKESAERMAAIRAAANEDIAKLTLDEFKLRRREIELEFQERMKAFPRGQILEARDGIARGKIIEAYWLKRQKLDKDMRRAELQSAIDAADAEAAVSERFAGQVTQARIDARRALLATLTEGTAEYFRLLAEIRGLERERAQQIVEQKEAMVALGLATREQALAARQALLGTLIPGSAEWLRLLKEIRDETILLSGDPWMALSAAVEENARRAFDWRQAWSSSIDAVRSSLAEALLDVLTFQKGLLEGLRAIGSELLRILLRPFVEFAAQDIVRNVLAMFKLPALPQIAPLAAGAAAAAPVLTAAVAAGGGTAAAAMSLAIAGAGEGAAALIAVQFIAAGEVVAASIAAAMSVGIFGLAGGGVLAGAVVAAQRGLVAHGPVLAALSEGLPRRSEVVMPLPPGLTAEGLSRIVQQGAGGGDVNINFYNAQVRDDRDIRALSRMAADAVRYAKRSNHPLLREDR